jgi:peptidoglycan/LPS O-acetylase OafA/YrhL
VHIVAPQTSYFHGGYVGVDVFFVLSGFLITTLLVESRHGYGTFIWRRVRRLYPPLIAAVAGGLALCAWFPQSPVNFSEALKSALMALTQTASPVRASGLDLKPFSIAWSLAIEWYFYLLWPLAVLAWKRYGVRWPYCSTTAAVLAVLCYVTALPLSPEWFYFGPLSRFAAMLAGGALAYWMLSHPRKIARSGYLSVCAVASVSAIVGWTIFGPGPFSGWYRAAGLPIIVAASLTIIYVGARNPHSITVRALSSAPARSLGSVSYTLYLWHMIPMILLTSKSFGLPVPALGLLGILMIIVLTAVAYVLVERPLTRARATNPKASSRGETKPASTSTHIG